MSGHPVLGAHVGQGQVQSVSDRGEPVATRLHLGDEAGQGDDRPGPVTAGVVPEADRARVAGRRGVRHHHIHVGPRPVLAVGVVHHCEVAQLAGLTKQRPVRVVVGVGPGRVREAQQPGLDPRGVRDRQLGLRVLQAAPPRGQRGEVGMGEAVHAEFVTLGDHLTHQLGVARDLRPDDEEGRLHLLLPQQAQDLGSPRWIWTVVEGEGHGPGWQPVGLDLTGGGVEDRTPVQHRIGNLVLVHPGVHVVRNESPVGVRLHHQYAGQDNEQHRDQGPTLTRLATPPMPATPCTMVNALSAAALVAGSGRHRHRRGRAGHPSSVDSLPACCDCGKPDGSAAVPRGVCSSPRKALRMSSVGASAGGSQRTGGGCQGCCLDSTTGMTLCGSAGAPAKLTPTIAR